MNKDTYYQVIIQALDLWKSLGEKRATLAAEIKRINPQAKASKETLSKINQKDEQVSEGNLLQIHKSLVKILQSRGFEFDETNQNYYSSQPDAMGTSLISENSGIGNLAGLYESYHLAKVGSTIIKTIIQIQPHGEVRMWGDGVQYQGQARIFKSNLLSIFFQTAQNGQGTYPFFIQLICNVGNYWQLSGNEIRHFFGIASSVSMDNEPMAQRRILIRVADYQTAVSHFSAQNISFESSDYQTLNQKYQNLGEFLRHKTDNLLLLPNRVNDPFD